MTSEGVIGLAQVRSGPIPAHAGIGLREAHFRDFLAQRPDVGFVEVHSENFMGAGGVPLHVLEQVRRDYPVSLHGVALSLGSDEPVDRKHLERIRNLIDRFEPMLVSEHLSWSASGGVFLNDLLPLPLTDEALCVFADNVSRSQDALGRPLLIENPSAYLRYAESPIPEPEFLARLVALTGCALLLDVNNVAVSVHNLGGNAAGYIDAIPEGAVGEVHLAGHHVNRVGDRTVRIDDHGSAVSDEVWGLYAQAVRRFGAVPALVEWDSNLPALATLVAEAEAADAHAAAALEGPSHAHAG